MYTKQDLLENQKMNNILKENQLRMRKHFQKIEKQEKFANIFMNISVSIFFIGLMYLVAVIENWSF